MILDKNKPVYTFNVKEELKDKKDDIIKDILKAKRKHDQIETTNYNFEVATPYHDDLYNLFIKKSKGFLNSFTLADLPLKVWCYFTGASRPVKKDIWHNHLRTSNINAVLYLKTLVDHGIQFKMGKESWYLEPQNFDLLIFPGFLDHRPVTSTTQERISLNLELKCNETEKDIFGL